MAPDSVGVETFVTAAGRQSATSCGAATRSCGRGAGTDARAGENSRAVPAQRVRSSGAIRDELISDELLPERVFTAVFFLVV